MAEVREYDAIVIGSGFGGSVAALRLAEKGYRVCVLEQGRRVTSVDIEAANTSPFKLLWLPAFGLKGFFSQRLFRHFAVVGGVGVGGGSLVYGAVLLEPKESFRRDPVWSRMGLNFERDLGPHYGTAKRMLGRDSTPYEGQMDLWLREAAEKMGAGSTFGPVPLGIYFGQSGVTKPDPYFSGHGPARTGCTQCGRCMAGCAVGAKNSLDKNYLFLAERKGVEIAALRRAERIVPLSDGAYEVEARHPLEGEAVRERFRARRVFIAAGVLGTVELLLRNRDEFKTLPNLSGELGHRVRTNSEAIVAIAQSGEGEDLSRGTAISSHFFPNQYTHITQNRFPPSYEPMKWYMGPLVDGRRPWWRSVVALSRAIARAPWAILSNLGTTSWHKRVSVLTVMQALDNELRLRLGRSWTTAFRRRLVSEVPKGHGVPTYIEEANVAARRFAEASGGVPLNMLTESVGHLATTAHVLGGAAMAPSPAHGVIDASHQVFHYPGLFVVDGSALPINVGVNPSLTITALAERCMSLIPPRGESG